MDDKTNCKIMVTMSMPSRLEYLKKAKRRYLKTSKIKKQKILDELCANTGYNRKYVIGRLSPKISLTEPTGFSRKKRKKKSCRYTTRDIYWLAKIWEIMDYLCGQRLQPVLCEMITVLKKHKELAIPDDSASRLKRMSSATIDNRLKPYRKKIRTRINSTTRPGSLLKKQIPIRTSSWNESRIGCCELDTVAHCGSSAAGEFINSLNITDILTQWTETAAIQGKAQKRVKAGLDEIQKAMPFAIVALDPDNGSEFINWQLFHYCMDREIEFTRGRPYEKNDNAHIEQKNWTHVRKLFGYRRLETEKQLQLMNDLYRNDVRLYNNFFSPSQKLVEKKRVGKHGEKIKRTYDKAKTPYQRVLECDQVDQKTKEKLKKQYEKLNPAELRRNILLKCKRLSKLINPVQNQQKQEKRSAQMG
jgi:hypothetical protein